ncbi:MAG TPA: DNA polymerase III subunit gamma/tau [Acidimicrobiales bacterium]|nr:DNA polymerase III subunit gamma/tau [Acidimicrobiales bacterium]
MVDPAVPQQPATYQSLYRRFRPQCFSEVLGQEHVSLALGNAVRQATVGHAYLFSGPRGTGKTSTARILAKALNCAAPEDGEPCGICDSCVEIARGTSLDVHELDAASNNGVDAMRDLVARAALGTPGRWKVYIVDEVHMLSPAASNALLKTLEEPPGHVVFVLATTDAQKVLPTIRSRTQHFEFRLLGPETLADLVRHVRDAAELPLGDDAVSAAVRKGRGSARDALSALDQVAAAGVVDDEVPVLNDLGEALAEHDAGRALVAVAAAMSSGRDVAYLTTALVEHLRQGFLATVAPELVTVAGEDSVSVADMARRMGLPAVVRAMEMLGAAQIDMRDAPDPRVHLETALIRLTHPEADDRPAALLERLDRIERAMEALGASAGPSSADVASPRPSSSSPQPSGPAASRSPNPAPPSPPPPATGDSAPAGEAPADAQGPLRGPDLARQSLGAVRRSSKPSGASTATITATHEPATTSATGQSPLPTRDELVQAWGDSLLTQLSNRARARFRVGRFVAVDGTTAVFALPNETHRSYCEEVRSEVEHVLGRHFHTALGMRLVVDDEAPTPPAPAAAIDEAHLLDPEVLAAETEPAGAGLTPEQRLKQMFPGAEEL